MTPRLYAVQALPSSSMGLKRASHTIRWGKGLLFLLGLLTSHSATEEHDSSPFLEPLSKEMLHSMTQDTALTAAEHESSYQHESQWDRGVDTTTHTELWAPEYPATEEPVSAIAAWHPQEALSVAPLPSPNNSKNPKKDGKKKVVSLLSKTLAGCILAACLALILLRRVKGEEVSKPPMPAPPPEPKLPPIECDLELLTRVSEAAEHLDALLGDPAVESMAMSIGRRVNQVKEAYLAWEQGEVSSERKSSQTSPDSSFTQEARKKQYEENMHLLLAEANQLLTLSLPSIRHYPRVPERKAAALRESAKATKELWAAAPSYFSGPHITLVDHFAADAETYKHVVAVLANHAEQSARSKSTDLQEVMERFERTASLVARMGRLAWRCTKHEDLFTRWNRVAIERLMKAARMEGVHLRVSLDTLREQTAIANFNSEAATVAAQFSRQLDEIQDIHKKAPTTRELLAEPDPGIVLGMVEQLRVAEREARERASLTLEGIRAELDDKMDVEVREIDLYKHDEVTAKIFVTLAEVQAALAEGSAALTKANLNEMPILQETAHKQVKSARQRAVACADDAAAKASEAREAAEQASEATTCEEAYLHFMATTSFFERSIAGSQEAGRQGLMEAAWEYLDATARESMRQIAEATKRLTAEGETNDETSEQLADMRNSANTLLNSFAEAQDLEAAFALLLQLREIMKQVPLQHGVHNGFSLL